MSTTTTVVKPVQTVESIKSLLEKSPKAIERAILAIYERQTEDEKVTESTNHNNGIGFSGVDAEILSSFATQIMRKQAKNVEAGKCLSEKQMVIAKKRIMVYARQLAQIANDKAGFSQEEVKAFIKAEKKAKALASLEAMTDEPKEETPEAPKASKVSEIVLEDAPKVAPKAPVAYWLMTPHKGWKSLTKAEAQTWTEALIYNVGRMGHTGKVGIKPFETLEDGDFQINYGGELLQVMEPGFIPDTEAWAEKVARREMARLGFSPELVETRLAQGRAKRQAEREAKAAESLKIEREMWEMEAEAPKVEALAEAKSKISAWLSK